MKKFKMTHLVFKTESTFDEKTPPSWMISKSFNWWWEGYVLKLAVGKHIDSDFQRIKRIA